MKLGWLKPNTAKVAIFIIALLIPFLRERAPTSGEVSVAYYSIGQLLGSYLILGDWYPFFQMLAFSAVIYIAVAAISELAVQAVKKNS